MKKNNTKIALIYSAYQHHSPDNGYKQIVKFIPEAKLFGIDYNRKNEIKRRKLKYPWLAEFEAYKKRKEIDVLHIMYAEEYFRFSALLFKNAAIVLTFHQPADLIKEHLEKGNQTGRIDSLTDKITKNRFEKVNAVIVTEETQKEVLKKVVSEDKIHVIPLGIYVEKFKEAVVEFKKTSIKQKNQVLVVGNWLRDWDFLIKMIEYYEPKGLKFILINRSFTEKQREVFGKYKNWIFLSDINDHELKQKYFESKVHLMPLIGAAGNNALMESLAMGCPVVMSDVVSDNFPFKSEALFLYDKLNLQEAINKIDYIMSLEENEYQYLREQASFSIKDFDWSQIVKRTKEVYNKVIDK